MHQVQLQKLQGEPGASDELAGIDVNCWATSLHPHKEGVYKPETVNAVLPPRVSQGEEFGLCVFTVPVLHRITYNWDNSSKW